ncbi:MAG: inositol monophosphatase family protein [Alphaproteobacteria bacterium]
MKPEPDRVCEFLRETAEIDVLPRFRDLAAHQVMEKKPGDLVTIADLDAEERLTRLLGAHVPGSIVVGEEGVHRDPGLLDKLETDDDLWIIDPVDGTQNFAAGKEPFAIVVAFLSGGRTRCAWIHDPVGGDTAVAEEGSGAWIGRRRLEVAEGGPIEAMTGLINSNAYGREHRDAVRPKKAAFREVLRYGSAASAFRALAAGERDFSVYNHLWSWDHAAGVLIHREAGGYTARVDGVAYRPVDRAPGLLSAPDAETWRRIDEFLKPG